MGESRTLKMEDGGRDGHKRITQPVWGMSTPVWEGVEALSYPDIWFFDLSGNRSGCSIDSIPKSTSSSGQ